MALLHFELPMHKKTPFNTAPCSTNCQMHLTLPLQISHSYRTPPSPLPLGKVSSHYFSPNLLEIAFLKHSPIHVTPVLEKKLISTSLRHSDKTSPCLSMQLNSFPLKRSLLPLLNFVNFRAGDFISQVPMYTFVIYLLSTRVARSTSDSSVSLPQILVNIQCTW